ncbi:MAG TPA: S49 family peptidase [Flavobacteriales bacterium]|nr:S49 family peptidase [Flavobacteriales bacterium]
MPRHIAAILGSPRYALDMRMGGNYLQQVLARAGVDGLPMGLPSEEERSADWFTEFVKKYGCAHYYVNTDGSMVHSLDEGAHDKVKPGAIAVVPVRGLIVKEADQFEEAYWEVCSTQRLAAVYTQLLRDDRVVAAVQRSFSGGGQVWGTEAYGEATKAFAAEKPLIGQVDHIAASAAYWGSCNCTQILLDGKTSEVGSIGVMTAWFDIIPYFEKEGIKYREYYAPESEKKNEDWRALREKENSKLIEEGMSPTAQLFIETVQEGRGARLNKKDPAILQGRMYQGQDAIDAGLADGFGTLADAIALARTLAPKQDEEQPENPQSIMSIKTKLVAMAAALFADKAEVKSEDIAEANAELAEKNITNVAFVDTAEQKRLGDAAASITAAEGKVTEANAKVTAAEKKATNAEGKASKAAEDLTAATKATTELQGAIDAAFKKTGLEAKEGSSPLELMVAALEASTKELAEANKKITKLEADPAVDGKPAGAVDTKGDVNDHGNGEKLTPEEEAFRNAELTK